MTTLLLKTHFEKGIIDLRSSSHPRPPGGHPVAPEAAPPSGAMGTASSKWQYERTKNRREAAENTREKRCARWKIHWDAKGDGAHNYTTNVTPCACLDPSSSDYSDGAVENEPDQPEGCEFLPYESMHKGERPFQLYYIVGGCVLGVFALLFCFCCCRITREERAAAEREERASFAAALAEIERMMKAHSGRSFAVVEQPDGLAGLAEAERVDVEEGEARSMHWFPYDRVGVVNADP